eukprot:9743488-Heterocapsa_arctica.AAC.1
MGFIKVSPEGCLVFGWLVPRADGVRVALVEESSGTTRQHIALHDVILRDAMPSYIIVKYSL